jgi:heme/copper-type cytochrome/quinol oxidase subunit 2
LDATQYEYAPGRVRVNEGDQVVLTLTASDVVHGFYLDGYGLEPRVEPGVSEQITFVADKAGKFRYRCSVSCGPLHPFMSGELVVASNTPFWRAIGLVLVAAGGMLVVLWRTGKNTSSQEVISGTG